MKKIDHKKLGESAGRKIKTAIGVGSSRLSRERERVLKYYNATEPKPQHAGQASYISADVYNAVEAQKAQLLDCFANDGDIIRFTPQGPEDVEAARIATEFTNYVLHRLNPSFSIFHDVIHDGLLARVGIVKVYWEDRKEFEDRSFEGLGAMEIEALMGMDDISELEAEIGDDGLYSGKFSAIVSDDSQVVIETVPPECFGIDPEARCLEGSFHFHRVAKSKGELAADGYDVGLLRDVPYDADDWNSEDTETDARFSQIGDGFGSDRDDHKKYWVYECYLPVSSDDGRDRLYKIVRVGEKTLACDEVDRSPFHVFAPLRTSHSFFGQNFAARVIPFQNARTVLTRGILDSTAVTSTPRYLVAQGALTSPRELIDNRLGGIVNVRSLDSVAPLPQPQLNPYVFQSLAALREEGEQTTGISSLSTGLNKDAISSQNSQGLVEGLVSLSQTRSRIIARNFGTFLKGLFIEIYRLVLENQDRKSIVELTGNWVEVDVSTWISRKDAVVSLHLSQSDKAVEAAKFTSLMTMAASDDFLSKSLGQKGRFNAAVQVLKMNGIQNVSDFLTPPDQLPQPQPDPMAMKQLELQERQIAAQEMMAKAQMAKAESDAMIKAMKVELDKQAAQLNRLVKMADVERKDLVASSDVDVAQRETDMLERQLNEIPPGSPASPKGIISPSS